MTTPDTRSSQWLKSNLAALGSAAVLTVYAAGWARTKAASDLLDEQAERRLPAHRPAVRATVGEVAGTPVARTADTAKNGSPAPAVVEPVAATAKAGVSSNAVMSAPTVAKAAAAPATTSVTPSSVTPKSVAPSITAPTPQVTATTAPVAVAPSATTSVSVPTSTTPAPAPSAPAQSAAIVPGAPRDLATDAQATTAAAKGSDAPSGPVAYKDGVYSGWGTSRHGDIEAYVEIRGGKIKSAFISECLTQYSCSWIAKLPPMVIEAQSAEIDYISGATHSSNAFYYAVVNALKKAR